MKDADRLARRAQRAVNLIGRYGGIDGEHHKTWLIDQVMRVLLGAAEYRAFRKDREAADYGWDEGCPP